MKNAKTLYSNDAGAMVKRTIGNCTVGSVFRLKYDVEQGLDIPYMLSMNIQGHPVIVNLQSGTQCHVGGNVLDLDIEELRNPFQR